MDKNITILIVDDVPANIKVLSKLLKSKGYITKGAADGEMALEAVDIIKPDLILLDIKMPKLSGIEVCEKIKNDPDKKDIPIIFITALSDTDSKVKAFEAGGVDYITKPFHYKEVLARVKTQLEISSYSKMLQDHNLSLEDKLKKEYKDKLTAVSWMNATFEQSHLGMVFLDSDTKIFMTNRFMAKILGYDSVDELIGKSAMDLTEKKYIEENKRLFTKLKNDEISHFTTEKQCYKKDGTLIWINSSVTKVSIPGSEEYSFIAICEDIDEKKAMQMQLQENEDIMINQSKHASMGELIGMIAHQWKQPIAVINMIMNNIKVDLALDTFNIDLLEEDLDEVLNMTESLTTTMDDFRSFFKPNKEKTYSKISDLLDKTISIIGKSLKNNNIELQIKDSSQSEVYVYMNEIIQVLINIINNSKDAIIDKHLKEGKIIIDITEDEKSITISIYDNAGGIPDDILENIGKRYFTTKEEKGTGLGIYMAKIIIENRMDGKLEWYNNNEGACFDIKLLKE